MGSRRFMYLIMSLDIFRYYLDRLIVAVSHSKRGAQLAATHTVLNGCAPQ